MPVVFFDLETIPDNVISGKGNFDTDNNAFQLFIIDDPVMDVDSQDDSFIKSQENLIIVKKIAIARRFRYREFYKRRWK